MPTKVNKNQWEKDWSKVKKNDSTKPTPMQAPGSSPKKKKADEKSLNDILR